MGKQKYVIIHTLLFDRYSKHNIFEDTNNNGKGKSQTGKDEVN
jgi:hypothetical protein